MTEQPIMKSIIPAIVDPLDNVTDEFVQDPYPVYKDLREHAPLLWSESRRWWLVSKYDDAKTVFKDRRFTKRYQSRLRKLFRKVDGLARFYDMAWKTVNERGPQPCKYIVGQDLPEHAKFRNAANPTFSPGRIKLLEPFIREICNQQIEAFEKVGSCDLIKQYANDLPYKVISHIVGIPEEDQPRVREWAQDIALTFDLDPSEEVCRVAENSTAAFNDYFRPLLSQRKKTPLADLISEFGNSSLSLDEAIANLVFFTVVGYETTIPLIGNGLYLLLKHSDQLALLRQQPQLIVPTVEEILRFDSPVQVVHYLVNETVEMRDKTLHENDQIRVLIGSANRDPEMFGNPDVFDITRENLAHLSFGAGTHYCMGANLARLEAQIAISILLERIATFKLVDDKLRYTSRPRGPESLSVMF